MGLLYRVNAAIAAGSSLAAERWCYRPRRTRLLCAVSRGVAAELHAGFPAMAEAVRSIPNGVDATAFRPDPEARRAVRSDLGIDDASHLALFVGGDWERKGINFAVGALADAPSWHLAVAGAGDRHALLASAQASGTRGRIHLLGKIRAMARIYAAADAFVLPTAYEAFPLVTLEAAASGLPLLVTRVNGVDEILRDGCNGWFIERRAADIARRLRELSADPELARQMGAAARQAVMPYSWDTMAEGYMSLYAELRKDER